MSYLLDTHTYLWWVSNSDRLPPRVRDILGEGDEEVFFSAVSAWEIAIKVALGKLPVSVSVRRLVVEEPTALRLVPLPVTAAHAARVAGLPPHHSDPFDRMLVAQAQSETLVLLSKDRLFAEYEVDLLWDR